MANTLEMLAAAQFGPQAQAYVASAVHSSGPDLDWIEAYLGDRGDATFIDVGCTPSAAPPSACRSTTPRSISPRRASARTTGETWMRACATSPGC
jgi:hypothetical protein